MLTLVAPRRIPCNRTPAVVLVPASFVVITSKILDAERLQVALRGVHAGTFDGAKAHAVICAQAIAARFAVATVAEVQDADGIPLFSVQVAAPVRAGGAS